MQDEERIDADAEGKKGFAALEDWRKANEFELFVAVGVFLAIIIGFVAVLAGVIR